jgi:hypothetical protein
MNFDSWRDVVKKYESDVEVIESMKSHIGLENIWDKLTSGHDPFDIDGLFACQNLKSDKGANWHEIALYNTTKYSQIISLLERNISKIRQRADMEQAQNNILKSEVTKLKQSQKCNDTIMLTSAPVKPIKNGKSRADNVLIPHEEINLVYDSMYSFVQISIGSIAKKVDLWNAHIIHNIKHNLEIESKTAFFNYFDKKYAKDKIGRSIVYRGIKITQTHDNDQKVTLKVI